MNLARKECLSCGAALPEDGLRCTFCDATHVVVGSGVQSACPGCGVGNPPGAQGCGQCGADMMRPCPECRAGNPLASRYCHECRIELKRYRAPRYLQAPLVVQREEVEERVREWLDTRWFKARDLSEHLRLLEVSLVWAPVWRFLARAEGTATGQASQTHYRTVSRPDFGAEGDERERVDSEPYRVWHEVTKAFERELALAKPAASGADELYAFLGDVSAARCPGQPVEGVLGEGDDEHVLTPDRDELAAWTWIKGLAEEELRAEVLERVELLEVRWLGPRLELCFHPVWEAVYRYKNAHGRVRVCGERGEVDGKRVTLLTQLFS
ncbi:MAG: zinc ribbon domain-containing protein [Planctomycetota bacterium]